MATIAIILISQVSNNFINRTKKTSEQDLLERLTENANNESTNISYILMDNFTALETLALFIQSYDNLYNPELYKILQTASNSKNFVRISVSDENGNNISPDSKISILDREYFKIAMKGQSNISDLIISRVDGIPCVIFAVPIKQKNKVVGVLRSVIQKDKLNQMLNSVNFSGNEMAYIIQKDGTVLTHLNNDNNATNIYDILSDNDTISQLKNDIKNNKNGFLRCDLNNINVHLNYTTIKGSNWYLINAIPSEIINQRATRNMYIGYLLVFQIIMILLLVVVVVFYVIIKKNRAIKRLASTIQNITQNVPGGVFRFRADTFEFDFISDGILTILGYSRDEFREKYNNQFNNFIIPAERDSIINSLAKCTKDSIPGSIQYQTINASGDTIWIHNVINLVTDESGKQWFYAIMVDITDYKQIEKMLVQKAEKDPLTNLYNKTATQALIEKHLQSRPDGIQALFVLDLDNFKIINDTYGHPYGDVILETFANRIKQIFRSNDILGRIGGDEFIIYMKSCFGTEYVIEKANLIQTLLTDLSLEKKHPFTFSIGIAFFPTDGNSFDELFSKADLALYESKAKGKNCYTIYGIK